MWIIRVLRWITAGIAGGSIVRDCDQIVHKWCNIEGRVVGNDICSEVVAKASGVTHFAAITTNNWSSQDAAGKRMTGSSAYGAVIGDGC